MMGELSVINNNVYSSIPVFIFRDDLDRQLQAEELANILTNL